MVFPAASSVELLYMLRINCLKSHALGIQILTNEIVADVGDSFPSLYAYYMHVPKYYLRAIDLRKMLEYGWLY